MKKKLLALLLSSAMALSMTACGSGSNGGKDSGGQTADKGSKEDGFVGEPQMLPNFYEAGFCADLSEMDSEVGEKLVDYTHEVGKDDDGVLRAISYQATPGSVIYRCDLAKKVFGTDDLEEIGKKFSSFDSIAKTAEELDKEGYSIFGDTGALRWFSNSSSPWVKDRQIIVDQERLDYFDTAVDLYQKEYVAFASEWSPAWYASMAGPLPKHAEGDDKDNLEGGAQTEVFSYVMPSWGALIVRDNAADNKGKFGVCSGVCSFFGGGTYLAVNEFSEHQDAAKDFVKYCTLNDDTAQWWLEASNGDVVSNKKVLESNKDYKNKSFNNQNTYSFYLDELEKVDRKMGQFCGKAGWCWYGERDWKGSGGKAELRRPKGLVRRVVLPAVCCSIFDI